MVEFNFLQSSDALGVPKCPEQVALTWAGWEDWHILCHEMMRLMCAVLEILLSIAVGVEKLV